MTTLFKATAVRLVQCAIYGVIGGVIVFFVSGYSLELIVRLTGYQGDTSSCIRIASYYYCPCGVILGFITPFITEAPPRKPTESQRDNRVAGLIVLVSSISLIAVTALTLRGASYGLSLSMWPVALWGAWCIHNGWSLTARQ